MKRISTLTAALVVLTQAAPAFAYTQYNWPGMASSPPEEEMNLFPDGEFMNLQPGTGTDATSDEIDADSAPLPAPGFGGDISSPLSLPEGMDLKQNLTRAEFTQVIVRALFPAKAMENCLGKLVYEREPRYRLLFADMSIEHPAAIEVCTAMRAGLVRGYDNGSFRPDALINFAEASKILSRIYALTPYPIDEKKRDWYMPYVQALAMRNAIPGTINGFASAVTVADLAEILVRIHGDITWRPSLTIAELQRRTNAALKAKR